MLLHLPSQAPLDLGPGQDGSWLPLDSVIRGFGFEVKQVGADGMGICPTDDVCVIVPASIRRSRAGRVEILAEWLEKNLGIVLVGDEFNAVMLSAPRWQPASDLQAIPADFTLSDVVSGTPTPLISGGKRTVVFAWASW